MSLKFWMSVGWFLSGFNFIWIIFHLTRVISSTMSGTIDYEAISSLGLYVSAGYVLWTILREHK